MSTLGDRTFLDLSLTVWTASTRDPKADGLASHLDVLVFASEKGRRWASIVRGSLHLYSPRDLRDLLEQAKALPGAPTTPGTSLIQSSGPENNIGAPRRGGPESVTGE